MPDYMTFYNLLRKEGRVGKDFASEIAEELVTLTAIAADRAAAPVSVAEPVATTETTLAEYETAIETLRHVIECLRKNGSFTDEEGEATDFLEPLLAAQPAADNAPQAPSAGSVPAAMGMLRCLQYVECVYRLNCVAEGEPSSTLKYMQDVIAANAQANPAPSVLMAGKIVTILRAYTDMDALPGDALVVALLAASMGGEKS